MENLSDLIAVLIEARGLIARPENDFPWSSWQNANQAFAEIDGLLQQLEAGKRPGRASLEGLFLPSGPIQDLGLSSGWGHEFLELADRFDAVMMDVYSKPQSEVCDCLTTPNEHLSVLQELGSDRHFARVSLLICRGCGRHWLKYFAENEAFTASGRWFLGAISFDQHSNLKRENARLMLEGLDWYFFGGSYFDGKTGKTSGALQLF